MYESVDDAAAARAGSLRFLVPPQAHHARYVRRRIVEFISACDVVQGDVDDLTTAIGEAFANAVEHACTTKDIELTCCVVSTAIVVTVVDAGVGFLTTQELAHAATSVDLCHERGRGIAIMRECTDRFVVQSSPGRGTSVRLTRFLRP